MFDQLPTRISELAHITKQHLLLSSVHNKLFAVLADVRSFHTHNSNSILTMMIEIDITAATSPFHHLVEKSSSMVADENSFRTEMTEVLFDEFLHSDCSCSNDEDDDQNLEDEGVQDSYLQVEKEHTCNDQKQQLIQEEKKDEESFSVIVSVSEDLPARKSILRRLSEPIPIHEGSSAWKVLPKPDMERVSRSVSEGQYFVKSQQRRTSGVVFKDVLIREYDQTVGDNPSVSYGPPISLDWDYKEIASVTLDEYEGGRAERRNLRQMILSYYQRRNLLAWQYGVSEEELKLAKRRANKCKSERAFTNFCIPAMIVETALESARRKAKRLVGKNNPKTN
jgi:hypothetical protein